MSIDQRPSGVKIALMHPEKEPLSLEIQLTEHGPILRTQVTAVEMDVSQDIVARCRRFEVDARESVSLRAHDIVQTAEKTLRANAGEVELEATTGDIRLRANDDVQLLGEQVLLNCERPQVTPQWIALPAEPERSLPRQDVFGDADLTGI